jgi:hypothetical protein
MNIKNNNNNKTEYLAGINHEYNNFKNLYEIAKKDKKESFIYDGQEILVAYAKYVLEHIQSNLDDITKVINKEPADISKN